MFDWHFTPTHNSSGSFATLIGSALHVLLRTLQPGHGWLTRFQVRCMLPIRAVHARVRSASGCYCLRRQHTSTRRVILQKARDHTRTIMVPRALTAWTREVSGSISLPSPGYFSPFPHGTVHYRSRHVASLGPWSAQLPTRLLVSGGTRDPRHSSGHPRYGTVTRSGRPFQVFPVRTLRCCQRRTADDKSHNPNYATRACLARSWFRHQPVSLATTPGGFSFPPGTEMFQFPDLPSLAGYPAKRWMGCPIRTRSDLQVTALPRPFRCGSASFIGMTCPGILLTRIIPCLVFGLSTTQKNPLSTLTMNLFRC